MRPVSLVLACIAVAGCAGRDPQQVSVVQPHDATSTCAMISAEIAANNELVTRLAVESGMKVVQNVGTAAVGVVVWPVLFAMDFKGAANAEMQALQARQTYLAHLLEARCAQRPPGR